MAKPPKEEKSKADGVQKKTPAPKAKKQVDGRAIGTMKTERRGVRAKGRYENEPDEDYVVRNTVSSSVDSTAMLKAKRRVPMVEGKHYIWQDGELVWLRPLPATVPVAAYSHGGELLWEWSAYAGDTEL